MEKPPRSGPFQIRASDAEKVAWKAAAFAAGEDASAWARDLLNAATSGRTAGVKPPEDAEFAEALEGLRMRYGVRDPAEILRMAVMAAARRDRAGVNPWLPVALKGDGESEAPAANAPTRPGGKPRR